MLLLTDRDFPILMVATFRHSLAPRLDLQYGYRRNYFSPHEAGTMNNHHIKAYAKPSSADYWPFFFVELKAASRQGTHNVGEN